MILVVLDVNGTILLEECDTPAEAREKADALLEDAKKHFPNKTFEARFYRAERMDAAGQ